MIVLIALVSLTGFVAGNPEMERMRCFEILKDDIRAHKDKFPNDTITAENEAVAKNRKICTHYCRLQITKPGEKMFKSVYKGAYQSPDYASSTIADLCTTGKMNDNHKVCLGGKCETVEKTICEKLMGAEVEKNKKAGKKMTFGEQYDGCKGIACFVHIDGKFQEVKKFKNPDLRFSNYHWCGDSDDKYKMPNFCKSGECVTVDGKKAKKSIWEDRDKEYA